MGCASLWGVCQVWALGLGLVTSALAQVQPTPPITPSITPSITLSGMMGGRALLIVDGKAPKAVAAGETHLGVTVVSTQGDSAVLSVNGRQHSLRVGDAPASVGAQASGAASGPSSGKIVMQAQSGGHFTGLGQINGKSFQFLVDTGATTVALGMDEANRLGINFQNGGIVRMGTANGVAMGWRTKLAVVRVGDVDVYDVDAVVMSGSLPYALLGNTFLTRFQMTRTNDQLVLVKRF